MPNWIVVFATQDMNESTRAEMLLLQHGVEVLFWNLSAAVLGAMGRKPEVTVEDPFGPDFEGAKLAVKEEQFDQARDILEREGFYEE